jgi:hypothetical protein
MVESPEELDALIRQFQQIVWNTPGDKEDAHWKILSDLAYDLDFYVPDPKLKAEDQSYYDKDRALEELKTARHKLHNLPDR